MPSWRHPLPKACMYFFPHCFECQLLWVWSCSYWSLWQHSRLLQWVRHFEDAPSIGWWLWLHILQVVRGKEISICRDIFCHYTPTVVPGGRYHCTGRVYTHQSRQSSHKPWAQGHICSWLSGDTNLRGPMTFLLCCPIHLYQRIWGVVKDLGSKPWTFLQGLFPDQLPNPVHIIALQSVVPAQVHSCVRHSE